MDNIESADENGGMPMQISSESQSGISTVFQDRSVLAPSALHVNYVPPPAAKPQNVPATLDDIRSLFAKNMSKLATKDDLHLVNTRIEASEAEILTVRHSVESMINETSKHWALCCNDVTDFN